MGIKNIKVLINKYSPQSIRKINLKELTGKTIAIDVSIYLYKYKYGNNNNEVKNFLTSFFHSGSAFLQCGHHFTQKNNNSAGSPSPPLEGFFAPGIKGLLPVKEKS